MCLMFKSYCQTIVLSREQVLKLPCKILKNTRGDITGGYYNQKDSSLYNCRGNFKKTLPGGFVVIDTLNCAEIKLPPLPKKACKIDYLSSITFKTGSLELRADAKTILANAASQLNADSTCGIKIVSYVADPTAKKAYQLSWDRLNTVIKFLIEKQHVASNRILFSYDDWGSVNTLDLLPTTLETLPILKAKKPAPIQ